jgi:hypothetical protein
MWGSDLVMVCEMSLKSLTYEMSNVNGNHYRVHTCDWSLVKHTCNEDLGCEASLEHLDFEALNQSIASHCNFTSCTYFCLAWAYVDSRNWQSLICNLVWAVTACSLCSWSSACKAPQCENKVQQRKHRFLRYTQVHERKQNQEMRWDNIQFLKQINRHHCTWRMVKRIVHLGRQTGRCVYTEQV